MKKQKKFNYPDKDGFTVDRKDWTEEEIIALAEESEAVLDKLIGTIIKKGEIVFSAKLGFGVPKVDLVSVDKYNNTTGYILKFPVMDGGISTVPYFQGFGESNFITDQMFDKAYLIVPEIELSDNTPFTRSPDPLYRIKNTAFEAGLCVFDKNYDLKVKWEPKGSLAKQYRRLKIELNNAIIKHGQIVIGEGNEGLYDDWKGGVEAELASLGSKRLIDKEAASQIVKQMLQEKNYRDINLEVAEVEIEAKPAPLPVFNVRGKGLYLGDEKEFFLQLSRISGIPLKREY